MNNLSSLCLRCSRSRIYYNYVKNNHHRHRLMARTFSSNTQQQQEKKQEYRVIIGNDDGGGSAGVGLFEKLKLTREKEIQELPETMALNNVESFLSNAAKTNSIDRNRFPVSIIQPPSYGYKHEMDTKQIERTMDAAMATFCMHVESRIAAMVGKGFYTIGPCGEEMLSSIGNILDPFDSTALHYRHLGINLTRQLQANQQSLEEILLDRARGYTISRLDPVTGGVHCSIGTDASGEDAPWGGGDFIVTSTLASQCPSAVGRALGYGHQQRVAAATGTSLPSSSSSSSRRGRRPISLVTVGDGSVHNHHFWSAWNLARHAKHRSVKCPVLFGISDNGLSISYETKGYVDTLFEDDQFMPKYKVDNSRDMMEVYDKTSQAIQYARQRSSPALILYKNITRRFGHAATDRQAAYLEAEQIESMADIDVLESAMVQAVETFSAYGHSYAQLYDRFQEIQQWTRDAFDHAMVEPKVSREDMLSRVSQPMKPVPRLSPELQTILVEGQNQQPPTPPSPKPTKKKVKMDVMRKHMNKVFDEIMANDPSVMYIGEDVEHGGYYVVTEGLAKKYPGRVLDFPPDETSLLGAAMGFSQVGLTPIIEIPYAKYLDCGVDKYYEIAIMNWLSNGNIPNGMIVRLQGFDRGLFGGNFHTHNMLNHIPPGVDMVCYSNGEDYVRGMRNAIAQAKAGRVVVSVDCTALLNLRHLHDKDRGWLTPYPTLGEDDMMSFHDVRRYGSSATEYGDIAIVTYGNGVVTALQTRKKLYDANANQGHHPTIDIIDSPYISDVPDGLKEIISKYDRVIFADICKEGPGSNILSSTVVSLQNEGLLPPVWEFVAAPRTYNPLGSTCTFLNVEDIERTIQRVQSKLDSNQ